MTLLEDVVDKLVIVVYLKEKHLAQEQARLFQSFFLVYFLVDVLTYLIDRIQDLTLLINKQSELSLTVFFMLIAPFLFFIYSIHGACSFKVNAIIGYAHIFAEIFAA